MSFLCYNPLGKHLLCWKILEDDERFSSLIKFTLSYATDKRMLKVDVDVISIITLKINDKYLKLYLIDPENV